MIVVLERYHDDSNLNGALLDTDLADPNYIGTIELAWLRQYLKKTVRQGKERVILWVFWPLSQWYIQEV